MLEAAGWAVQDASAVNLARCARRRGARVRDEAAARPRRLPALRRRPGGRRGRGEEGGRDAHRRRVAERRSTSTGCRTSSRPRVEGALPFVYESTGDRDAVHEPLDPEPASRDGLLVPPAGDARRLARGDPPHPGPRRRCATGCASCRALDRRGSGRRRSRRSATSSSRSPRTGRGR